jgi:GNAT superfamily N-acetyltransferase
VVPCPPLIAGGQGATPLRPTAQYTAFMIEIGALRAEDRPGWQVLFAGYHEFYGRPDWPTEGYDRTWREILAGERIHALGARLDRRLVGITHFMVHANTTAADVCYLQDLFTDPEARGQGIARALIAAVEEWARERGCSRVYWHTHETNATARRLYDKVAENRGFIQYVIQL